MPKRKHVKKHIMTPGTDANQGVIESLREKERIRKALIAKQKKLQEEYIARMKEHEEMMKKQSESGNGLTMEVVSPKEEEAPKKPAKKKVSEIKAINALKPTEEEEE